MKVKGLLVLTLMALCAASAWAYDFSAVAPSGQTLYYSISGSNEVSVVNQNGGFPYYSTYPSGNLIIPPTVIHSGAVYIVKSIGNEAFFGCNLTSVIIPDGVTSIGYAAFGNCNGLTSVTIGSGVSSIGDWAFSSCNNLTSATIPAGVTYIGDYAFYQCSGLTSIIIPREVTFIGECAFNYCSGLTSVVFNADSCTVDIPNSNYWGPFYGCNNITNFTFGDNVRHIPSYICYDMSNLTSITIPSGVASIGFVAFLGCSGLTKTNYTGTVSQWCKIEFAEAANPISYSHNYFINDVEVKDLVIPDSVTSINNDAFYGCSGLTSVIIPDGVSSIGNYAFARCTGLTSVTIGSGVISIGGSAFSHCTGLTSVTILDGVSSIGNNAFNGCSGIAEINSMANVAPTLGYNSFSGVSSTIPVNIPCGSQTSYYSQWTYFSNFIEDGSFIFSVQSTDTIMGTVEVLMAPTCQSHQTVVNAIANTGFIFDHWSDGNNDNPRSLTLTSDSSLAAYFTNKVYDTIFIHDTTHITQHDTTYINVSVHDTTYINVPVHDTTYINVLVHDTTYINVPVHDTTYINVPEHDTTYINVIVHDTTYINVPVHDTTYINVPVHDTTYINVPVHDTTYISVPVHDTTYINMPVHDTTYINVPVHDTTYINVLVHDTTYINVPVHDTMFISVHDTAYINVPVHDTTYITMTDTLTVTQYDTVTNTVYDTIDNYIHDTVTMTDTLWLTQTDTLWLYDTIIIHDTVYITQEGIGDVDALNAKVYTSQGQILVEGANGNTVVFYDVNGRMLATKRDEYAPLRFDAPVSGTYMIKIGNHPARKVVVVR